MFHFVGRSNQTSDLVGEKLNASFLESNLVDLQLGTYVVLPVLDASPPYYCVLIERSAINLEALRLEIEHRLRRNFHYRYAEELGQLGPIHISIVPNLTDNYFSFFLGEGMKWGDIKMNALISDAHVAGRMLSCLVKESHNDQASRV